GFGGGAPKPDPALANYKFWDHMKDFKTTIKIPPHNLKFDETYFIKLLAGSISLMKDEKKRIVDSIPKLRQEQVDELIKILEEEKEKFIELSPKHAAQLKKLEDEHKQDWKDIEIMYEQDSKKKQEQTQVDDIKKQLGL
ncbi:MAG: hypothetical protein ACD_65C00020G0001, partial [uncultured bacterium]